MKESFVLVVFLLSFKIFFSQETPVVQIDDSLRLKLSTLKVDVKIIGNFATTTYDMQFYNELDRTLEGELRFPLGEGQSVSGFAMDVNGEMRDAVIVEKEKARVAFENTVRQNIDPGLLEKTQGNNYKARIYPILPKQYKRIRITYEQELLDRNYVKQYELPLNFTQPLDEFTVDFEVFKDITPITDSDELIFVKKDGKFKGSLHKKSYIASTSIFLEIPKQTDIGQVTTYHDFFYVNKQLEPSMRLKKKPKSITILWDASLSNKYRKLKKELELLQLYFNYLQYINVQFIPFGQSVVGNRNYKIVNGEWTVLKEEIEKNML